MKGCLILQRNFAYLGHDVALHLKEKYGVKHFCGYVYGRQGFEFLRAQKDIPYSTLLLDEEIHDRAKTEMLDPAFLDRLEKNYGVPNIWPALAVDRVLMQTQLVREYPFNRPMHSHEEMLRILQVTAKAIVEMLDREKPDFVFCSVVGAVGSWLLYHIAKKRGIKTSIVLMTSTKNRYMVSDAYDRFTDVDAAMASRRASLHSSPKRAQAEAYIREFRDRPVPYYDKSTPSAQPVTRVKQFAFLRPSHAARSIDIHLKNIIGHFRRPDLRDYNYINPWMQLWDLVKRKTRNIIGASDLYDPFTPDEDDFIFFPLHFEPEVSLLLLAPHAANQIEVVREVARALPVRMKLYVKDHPEMAQFRPRWYYKELKKNPNVKLIDPSISSFLILPKTKLVATITGTGAWEAALIGKPAISFGNWFYNALSCVQRCRSYDDLAELVKRQLEQFRYDEEEVIDYLTAIFEESAELNFHHLWQDETDAAKRREGVKPLADLLAKKLGLT